MSYIKYKVMSLTIERISLLNLVLIFCFFPFFKFIPWINAEVQPWGSLLALLCLVVFSIKKDVVSITTLIFLCLLTIYVVISIMIGRSAASVLLLFVAYSLPLFVLLALKDNTQFLSKRVLYLSVSVYIIVGGLQSFSFVVWAEPYVQLLIPRFLGRPNGLAGRGVDFLAQEPSGAGFIITLMLTTAVYFYVIGKVSGRALFTIALAVIAMLVMDRSGTAFLLLACFLFVFILMMFLYGKAAWKVKKVVVLIPFIPLAALVVVFSINNFSESTRFVSLLNKMITMMKSNDLGSLASLAALSGGRFVTVLMGYFSLSENFGLGHGIAAYQVDYAHLTSLIGIDWSQYAISKAYTAGENHKPNAYGAQIALDLGLIGLFLIGSIVFFCWKQKDAQYFWQGEARLNKSLMAAVFATALFIIFVRSTTAMPVAWVMLAYVHDYIRSGIQKSKISMAIANAAV